MAFCTDWEDIYRANTHLSIWPWSDLVSYVNRYAKPSAGFTKVLELGCGAGANIPLFLSMKSDYWAIEGSSTIVERVLATYPELAGKLVIGDFTKEISCPITFDLVVDRFSLNCAATESLRHALSLIFKKLRSGGKFIGIDWPSDQHIDACRGDVVDGHARQNFPSDSHLAGTGIIHFSDREHLNELLTSAGFNVERLEHKRLEVEIPSDGQRLGFWNFVAIKP